jgi:carboxyl-terminal processing protease
MQQTENQQGKHSSTGPWIAAVIFGMAVAFLAGFSVAKPGGAISSRLLASSATDTVIGVGSDPPSDISTPADFKEFWDLWRELKEKYYQQPVSDKQLFYGAMSGLASSLNDPYTVFFEPKSAQDFSDSLQGKFDGIGAEIGIQDDQLQIIAPLPDTPADKAGLKAGDYILGIDKKDTAGMSVEEAVSLIRGKAGTTVVLSIGHIKVEKDAKGKEKQTLDTKDVTLTRAEIQVKSVTTKYLDGNIAQITITNFNTDTADLFSKAVTDALSKDVKGVILDLRNDPGGYLDKATAVAGEWVGDQIVVEERQQGKITDRYRGTGSGRLKGIPTVVLVNQGSASASEIVTGALQDYGMATIVGTKTFGKGSVQDFFNDFSDKSAVKITIAEWVTPKERSINKVGIQPDVQVDRTEDDYNAKRDPQLDKAVQILTGKAPAAEAATSTIP